MNHRKENLAEESLLAKLESGGAIFARAPQNCRLLKLGVGFPLLGIGFCFPVI
jgi:hypothetical protein